MAKKSQYQQNLDEASAGANQSGPNPIDLANKLAGKFSKMVSQPAQGPAQLTNVSDPSLMSYEGAAQEGPHMENMRAAAEAAKQKYMQENGVDENGNPVAK